MTDITDQDRRDARKWAEGFLSEPGVRGSRATAAARVILATVDAPAPTLAEEWRDMLEKQDAGEVVSFSGLLARADQMEQERDYKISRLTRECNEVWEALAVEGRRVEKIAMERDEARAEVELWGQDYKELRESEQSLRQDLADVDAEVERLTAEAEELRRTDNYREFRDKFLTVQKGAESNAESFTEPSVQCSETTVTDPADVKPGEPWIVECDGEKRAAVKDKDDPLPWNTVTAGGLLSPARNADITLVSRLVPAPRVITNPDELDQAKRRTVILSTDGQADVYQKDSNGEWLDVTGHGYPSRQVIRMENAVTVLWEPEA